MIEYKTLRCDISSLLHTNKSKEEYVMSAFINSIASWVVDINNEYVTIEKEKDDKIEYVQMRIEDWDYFKRAKQSLEDEWYKKTIPGFEATLNELGQQNFKLIDRQNDFFIFMKEDI